MSAISCVLKNVPASCTLAARDQMNQEPMNDERDSTHIHTHAYTHKHTHTTQASTYEHTGKHTHIRLHMCTECEHQLPGQ